MDTRDFFSFTRTAPQQPPAAKKKPVALVPHLAITAASTRANALLNTQTVARLPLSPTATQTPLACPLSPGGPASQRAYLVPRGGSAEAATAVITSEPPPRSQGLIIAPPSARRNQSQAKSSS